MSSKTIQFRYRVFDTLRAAPGSVFRGARFFAGDGGPSLERVTHQTEAQILEWLLRTPVAREMFFEEIGLPQDTYRQAHVVEPLIDRQRPTRPGDIDVLLVPLASCSVAFQVKRVAVASKGPNIDRARRHALGNLEDLVEQANAMRELGFHKNYALVIVEVDGVARDLYNFASRGSTDERFRKIYQATWNTPIHSDVGVIFIEISQPTATTFRDAGVIGICVDKRAQPIDQPSKLTAKIRQLMATVPSL